MPRNNTTPDNATETSTPSKGPRTTPAPPHVKVEGSKSIFDHKELRDMQVDENRYVPNPEDHSTYIGRIEKLPQAANITTRFRGVLFDRPYSHAEITRGATKLAPNIGAFLRNSKADIRFALLHRWKSYTEELASKPKA